MKTTKVCLITGASKGIGKATAIMLAEQGYRLALMARDGKAMQEVARGLSATSDILLVPADLRNEENIEKGVRDVMDHFGHLDILVNNAGLGYFGPLQDISLRQWDEIMAVNVRSGFVLSKAVIEEMKASGGGHIVAVASDVSKRVFAEGSAYCASKYAQDAFFAALRKEVRASGIKVSTIYPGLVDTPFHSANPGPGAAEWLRAEDVAKAISFVVNTPPHVVIDELMIHPISQEY